MSNEQVFTGARSQARFAQPQQPGQPQQQQQANPLAAMAQLGQRFSGAMANGSNNMSSLYSYGSSKTNYASLLGLDETISEDQLKAQALNEAGLVAQQIVNICSARKQGNPFYKAWRAAMERFKQPKKNLPQDTSLVDFVNQIDSTPNLHNFILIQACVQTGADMGYALATGDETVRQNREAVLGIFYRCAVDSVNLSFMDFVGSHPQVYQRLSNIVKEVMTSNEERIFDLVISRYTFAGLDCPWRKGNMTNILERYQIPNPLVSTENIGDLGFGGSIFDSNLDSYGVPPVAMSEGNAANELRDYIISRARENKSNGNIPQRQPVQDSGIIQHYYDNYDQPELRLEDMTRENRHKYSLAEYASNIPGTEWYVVRPHHIELIAKNLVMDDGDHFRIRDTRCPGTVPVYRFDWREGTFNFRLVKHDLKVWNIMETLISNPEKLLPFMYEEDGVQKTTFDPSYMETDKFVREGVVVPMEEMKELKKTPDMLIGNRAVKMTSGNETTLKRVNVLTQTHDPKGKLDAFVLPMVNMREWNMEPDVDMGRFYNQFSLMVHNNKVDISDTGRVFSHLRQMSSECESNEFREFLEPYLTNLVNRWLIEVRGYAETKAEATASRNVSYLRVGNIFEDLEDLLEYLKHNDLPSLRALLDYKTNTFIRAGIEVLCSKEEVSKEIEEKYKSEPDDIIRLAMIKSGEKAIIIRRSTVFVNLVKMAGPYTVDAVVIKESGNPELFAIVRKALSVTSKHFDDNPQVLIKFNKDEGNKVWVATRSDFDPGSVFVLRSVSEDQDYAHPCPICA